MNTEMMHQTILEGESNQHQFFEQVEVLLNSKVYLEGIIIDGRVNQFANLRQYISDKAGLNMSIPVIAAMLLPEPTLRTKLLAILSEETKQEADSLGIPIRRLNRKYKITKDESKAQKDMFNNPDIHKAALAGIPLTNAQKRDMRKANKPEREPMFSIRYPAGDLRAALLALSKKHSPEEMRELPKLAEELFEE